MKKMRILILAIMAIFCFSSVAMAADDTVETLTLKDSAIVGNYSDVDYSSLSMTGTVSANVIKIEAKVLTYLYNNDMDITVDFGGVTMTFAIADYVTAEMLKSSSSGYSVGMRIYVDLNQSVSSTRYISNISSGSYLGANGISVNIVGIRDTTDYFTIDYSEPVLAEYTYSWDILYGSETYFAMSWADIDVADTTGYITWINKTGEVNTTTNVVTFLMDELEGIYYPMAVYDTTFLASAAGLGSSDDVNDDAEDTDVDTEDVVIDQLTGHWAEYDIIAMQRLNNVPSDLSDIDITADITRGEFSAYLVNVLGLTDAGTMTQFSDIDANEYIDEIYMAYEAGIVYGRTDTTFDADASITRQEMAAMMARALDYAGYGINDDTDTLVAFGDIASISTWAIESVAIAYNEGLMSGREVGTFAPTGTTSWAEAVVILYRLDKMI